MRRSRHTGKTTAQGHRSSVRGCENRNDIQLAPRREAARAREAIASNVQARSFRRPSHAKRISRKSEAIASTRPAIS